MGLTLGIQSFEDVFLCQYVDKTEQVWEIANAGRPCVLSRPRRFGKSLLISTFKAYFQGRKDLFAGLAIEPLEKKWEQYSVLHLDLSPFEYYPPSSSAPSWARSSVDEQQTKLEKILSDKLLEWETEFGVNENEGTLSERFARIIQHTAEQSGKGVVVLIDEYDKPLLETLCSQDLLKSHLSVLNSFYSVLKREERHLYFVFLTGITKLAQVSVLSEINQRNGSSLDRDFPTLCGFTREELTTKFRRQIESLGESHDISMEETLAVLTRRYGGYRFHHSGEQLFQPWSVLMAFHEGRFGDYSNHIGIPKILKWVVENRSSDLVPLLTGVSLDGSDMDPTSGTVLKPAVEPGSAKYLKSLGEALQDPFLLTYLCGYITVKDYDKRFDIYQLAFPNDEVRLGLAKFALLIRTPVPDKQRRSFIRKLVKSLEADRLKSFFATFDCFLPVNSRLEPFPAHNWPLIVHLVFCLMSEFIKTRTQFFSDGAGAVVDTTERVYKFLFKLDGTAREALDQVKTSLTEKEKNEEARTTVEIGARINCDGRSVVWEIQRQENFQ
ncbi:AAA-ATPase [Gregarina niphandrodes]|uniref:AAA-ATPase n=1 Tax=Gregarina niphandrodes TaxID=110365 RepID=A0A023BAI9_GRENI|nr:AAA-ATPase [Gregarina niphandrodes]EZG78335.1 AAA-ATPase [Gregarina niphandrodes]|eukprot:XP_011129340.1 AAA-ATPase [Gregarina niphandrodes]